ncbi:dynamin family protein [Nocardioides fonticola]|uniref:Dynamin family protein n=1 Tax=Nocardioides fonticola TaxID=450363 RepID=A0ABP7XJL1_9ACTN
MTASNDGGSSSAQDAQMLTALVRLRGALQAADLPFDVEGVEDLRASRRQMIDQLEDYVIPRVMTIEAPLVAVVGGSTGAGKSTLVNSLVGERVTTPGVLRPTTRSAVLVHHPDDAHWFGQDRLLPDLRRVEEATDDPTALQLVASERMPQGLALVDAPDVDSVEQRNRELAAQLLAAADLWLFVTSAARYADQVPWQHLRGAADRATAVAVILDRTPAEAVETVSTHLARMLASRGLKDSPIFVVHEGPIDDDGLLPPGHVADVRGWIDSLAADSGGRAVVVKQTLDGAIRSMTHHTYPLVEALGAQQRVAAGLREAVVEGYAADRDDTAAGLVDGRLLRGEVLARWQDFVGTGDLLRSLDQKVSWLRDRVVNAVKGKPQQAERVVVAVESAIELLVLEHAERAAGAVATRWAELPGGPALLAQAGPDLGRASRDLRRRAERAVRAWQEEVGALVRADGADKRSARYLAFGAGGLAVSLMVQVIAGASQHESAALGRQLLDAVFGEAEVTAMVRSATASLHEHVLGLLDAESERFTGLLGADAVPDGAAEALREAARRVDDARFAESQRGA